MQYPSTAFAALSGRFRVWLYLKGPFATINLGVFFDNKKSVTELVLSLYEEHMLTFFNHAESISK